MIRYIVVIAMFLPGCGNGNCPGDVGSAPNRFLWKQYKRDVGSTIKAVTRFLHGDLGNYEVCQEVADMYNAEPSVVSADTAVFSCGLR
jgi:hypothetical protein